MATLPVKPPRGNIFFNLREYFADASVSESSESVWLVNHPASRARSRPQVFCSTSMSGGSPCRTDLADRKSTWANQKRSTPNEKDIAYPVTSLCLHHRSRDWPDWRT